MTMRRAAVAFAVIILSNLASLSCSSPAGDDKKLEIEAIKRFTMEALSKEDRDKVDLNYITRELVERAKKEARPTKGGDRDIKVNLKENVNRVSGSDYGNIIHCDKTTVWYMNGKPNTSSYACDRYNWHYCNYSKLTQVGVCTGGYPCYLIEF